MSKPHPTTGRLGVADVVGPLVFLVGGAVYALTGTASWGETILAAVCGVVAGILAMQLPWPWLVLGWIVALVAGIGAWHGVAASLSVAWVAFVLAGGFVGTTLARPRRRPKEHEVAGRGQGPTR